MDTLPEEEINTEKEKSKDPEKEINTEKEKSNDETEEKIDSKPRRSTRVKKAVITYLEETLANDSIIAERLSHSSRTNQNDIKFRALETIFEEPKMNKNKVQYMSIRRLKRMKDSNDIISRPITAIKKKRLQKAGIVRKNRQLNVTLESVVEKLSEIE